MTGPDEAASVCDTVGIVYLNNRHHDPTLGMFVSVDPLARITGEPYIYGAGNPSTYSDPSELEVCYADPNHPKYGQCYEAADGEEWSTTSEEEVLTVDVPNALGPWMDPSGSLQSLVNVRHTALGHVTSAQLVDAWRYLTSMGFTGADRLAQLHLMLCDCGEFGLPGTQNLWVDVCVLGCISFGFVGGRPAATFGEVGLGLAATVEVSPAGACDLSEWALGGSAVVGSGGAHVGASLPDGGGWWDVDSQIWSVSGSVGFLISGAPVSGGPSYSLVAGC